MCEKIGSAGAVSRARLSSSRLRAAGAAPRVWRSLFDARWGDPSEGRPREHPLASGSTSATGRCVVHSEPGHFA